MGACFSLSTPFLLPTRENRFSQKIPRGSLKPGSGTDHKKLLRSHQAIPSGRAAIQSKALVRMVTLFGHYDNGFADRREKRD
jgi:hypothetical protein